MATTETLRKKYGPDSCTRKQIIENIEDGKYMVQAHDLRMECDEVLENAGFRLTTKLHWWAKSEDGELPLTVYWDWNAFVAVMLVFMSHHKAKWTARLLGQQTPEVQRDFAFQSAIGCHEIEVSESDSIADETHGEFAACVYGVIQPQKFSTYNAASEFCRQHKIFSIGWKSE